jgi:aldose 1-epimerase
MNFTIHRQQENGLDLVTLTDTDSGTIVSIAPEYGGLLHGFIVMIDDTPINIIDHYSGKEDITQNLSISYKGSKLSPFPCRISEGIYSFDDMEYEFKNKFYDGSAIHGLLYNKSFNITDEYTDDNSASLSLRYHYKREDAGYPFDYVCEIRYTLHPGNVLQIETTVLNLDDEAIPMADGWHPYFTLGNKVDDYIMQFNSASMLEFDEKLIPTGLIVEEPAFQVPKRIGERELDNCFPIDFEEGVPCCVLHNPNNKMTLSFYGSSNYPFLQIYTPSHRNSIAIENLSAAPDCFNNEMGLTVLAPRRSETYNVWYRVDV